MIKYRPFYALIQLARHGPAAVVIPVLIPIYSLDFWWTNRWVFYHSTVFSVIIVSGNIYY